VLLNSRAGAYAHVGSLTYSTVCLIASAGTIEWLAVCRFFCREVV